MILCCGEALIDMIPAPTRDGDATGFVPHCGGAIYNTAIALGRLGVPTGMLTGLSRDMFGQMLSEGLAASGVDTSHVITSDRPTTLAFVQLLDGHARYHFYDENSAGRMLSAADLPPLSEAVSALYFGGISLAVEPGADAYADLLARHGERQAIMLDPNIRPGFIRDADRYRARLDTMIAASDILKVSDEDLDWIIAGSESIAPKARALLDRGPSLVIVTRGGDGASAFLRDGSEVSVPAVTAQVADTVGAGDTFNAGVLAKLAELDQLTKPALAAPSPEAVSAALSHGARVAAVTVSRVGANPPWAHEL